MSLTGSAEKAAHWLEVAARDGLTVKAWQQDETRPGAWLFYRIPEQAEALRALGLAGSLMARSAIVR